MNVHEASLREKRHPFGAPPTSLSVHEKLIKSSSTFMDLFAGVAQWFINAG